MKKEFKTLYFTALNARTALRARLISYNAAIALIKPYTDAVNTEAVRLAREYGMRAKKVTPQGFLR